MNVKTLKGIINNLPDETPVLIPGSDHNYRGSCAAITTAIFYPSENVFNEDFDEDLTGDPMKPKRIRIVVIE